MVGLWLLLLLVALPLAPRASGALHAGGFDLADLESSRARAVLHDELGLPESALVLVYTSSSAEAGQPAFDAATAAARTAITGAPYVAQVLSYPFAPSQVSADGETAYDVVLLNIDPDDSPAALPAIQERIGGLPAGPVTIALAGGPAFYGDIQTVSESDLRRSEFVSLPLAGLALLLVFGSVVAAGVPLAVGGAAVVVSLAAIFVVASFTEMSIFVLNLATLLGLGLGVDYSLLMTSRFREELRRRAAGRRTATTAVAGAIQAAVATAGRAVFFSGLTVLLGLLGLVLFEFTILRSVGIAGAIVVGRGGPGGADPAAGDPVDPRAATRPAGGSPPGQAARRPASRGPASPAGSCAGRCRSSWPRWACCSCSGRPSCTSGPERPGRDDPAADRAIAGGLRPARRGVRGRPLRAAVAGHPDDGPGDGSGQHGRPVRLLTAAGGRSADHLGRRASWTSTRDSTVGQYQLLYGVAGGSAGSLRRGDPGGHDQGRPDGVHRDHAVRTERRPGSGPGRGPALRQRTAGARRPGRRS